MKTGRLGINQILLLRRCLQKGESIVLCKHCNYPNRIVRAFFWSGHNKGKMKSLSDMLCPNCGHFMGHNVIDGISAKNRDCLKMRR